MVIVKVISEILNQNQQPCFPSLQYREFFGWTEINKSDSYDTDSKTNDIRCANNNTIW